MHQNTHTQRLRRCDGWCAGARSGREAFTPIVLLNTSTSSPRCLPLLHASTCTYVHMYLLEELDPPVRSSQVKKPKTQGRLQTNEKAKIHTQIHTHTPDVGGATPSSTPPRSQHHSSPLPPTTPSFSRPVNAHRRCSVAPSSCPASHRVPLTSSPAVTSLHTLR